MSPSISRLHCGQNLEEETLGEEISEKETEYISGTTTGMKDVVLGQEICSFQET